MARWGYDERVWDRAVDEGRKILTERASRKTNQTISYSELASLIKSICFDAQDHAFHALLGDISVAEHDEGKGMLTVLVVYKGGDQMPGPGFFKLAEELGKDVRDKLKFWSDEFNLVLEAHAA